MNIAKPGGFIFNPTLYWWVLALAWDKITPVYWEALKASLQMPQSIGMLGKLTISASKI